MYILQSGRCQSICGSNLGCFSSSVENNDCGVGCKVSVVLYDLHQTQEGGDIYLFQQESDCSQGCQRFSQLPSCKILCGRFIPYKLII